MDWLTSVNAVTKYLFAGVITCGLLYFVLRSWRGRKSNLGKNKDIAFNPTIGFTRLDGGKSVAVLLENDSEERVWAEEIEIALTDLVAQQQCVEASCHETHKIHQTIREHDMLPVSLVEIIYQAAGQPQRRYSCVMSSIVRYRVGEKWYEEPMKTYRLSMKGLTIADIRPESRPAHAFKSQNESRNLHAVNSAQK